MKEYKKETKEMSEFLKQFIEDSFMKCPKCEKDTLWNNDAMWRGKNLGCTHCGEYSYYSEFTKPT